MLTAKWKLNFAAIFLAVLLIGYFIYYMISEQKTEHLKQGIPLIHQVNSDLLMLRRHEKDFLSRKEERYVQSFNESVKILQQRIHKLNQLLSHQTLVKNLLEDIESVIEQYQTAFLEVYRLETQIGLNTSSGLKHTIQSEQNMIEQKLLATHQDELIKWWYFIVKTEKSYLLSPNDAIYTEFNKSIQNLIDLISRKIFDTNNLALPQHLLAYQNLFSQLVKLQNQKGNTPHLGLQKDLGDQAHKLEHKISQLLLSVLDTTLTYETHHEFKTKAMMIFFPCVVLATALMPFFFFLLSTPQPAKRTHKSSQANTM